MQQPNPSYLMNSYPMMYPPPPPPQQLPPIDNMKNIEIWDVPETTQQIKPQYIPNEVPFSSMNINSILSHFSPILTDE